MAIATEKQSRAELVTKHLDSLLESDGKGGFLPTRWAYLNLYELLLRMVASLDHLNTSNSTYLRILNRGKFSDIQRHSHLSFDGGHISIEQLDVIRTELIDSDLPLHSRTFYERLDEYNKLI